METTIETVASPAPRNIIFISPDTDADEWAYAWDRVTRSPDDREETCPDCGEVWHYICSVVETIGRRATILHHFRHRHHPHTRNCRYELIPASAAYRRRLGCN